MRASKAVLGIACGVAAGAVLGVLMAPDSGVNTRKRISSKSMDAVDDIKNRFNNLVDGFTSQRDELASKIKSNVNQIKSDITRKTPV
jgi:gas vesicle protein